MLNYLDMQKIISLSYKVQETNLNYTRNENYNKPKLNQIFARVKTGMI